MYQPRTTATTGADPADGVLPGPSGTFGSVTQTCEHGTREVGDGGCDARALVQLGVFADEGEAAAALDAEIDPLWTLLKRGNPGMPRHEVGRDGAEWHRAIMPRVCRERGWSVKKHRGELNGTDSYFVDGFLSPTYIRGNKKEKTRVKGANFKGIAAKLWRRHATAVVNGKIRDHAAFIVNGEMPKVLARTARTPHCK